MNTWDVSGEETVHHIFDRVRLSFWLRCARGPRFTSDVYDNGDKRAITMFWGRRTSYARCRSTEILDLRLQRRQPVQEAAVRLA
jgi:hypothetical protein